MISEAHLVADATATGLMIDVVEDTVDAAMNRTVATAALAMTTAPMDAVTVMMVPASTVMPHLAEKTVTEDVEIVETAVVVVVAVTTMNAALHAQPNLPLTVPNQLVQKIMVAVDPTTTVLAEGMIGTLVVEIYN